MKNRSYSTSPDGVFTNKNEESRRKFLKNGLLSAVVFPAAITGSKDFFKKPLEEIVPLDCIDYGKSFFCNTAEFNSVRMWIESRTTIFDTAAGESRTYYQGASCKSENTFGETDLFYEDNYDFLPIFGDGQVLVFRRFADKRGDMYKSVKKMEEMWGANPVIYTPVPEEVTELDSFEKIRDASAAGIPIVTQTEFHNNETGLRAIIEAPCKTMNISHSKKMYQVDTGPIALPDLSKRYDTPIKSLSLAFIAFNKPHFADFVIEAPTPIMNEDKEVGIVYHYSKRLTLEVKNRIFGLGKV